MKKALIIALVFAACAGHRTDAPPKNAVADDRAMGNRATNDNQSRTAFVQDGSIRVAVETKIIDACDLKVAEGFFEFDASEARAQDMQLERVADCLANGKLGGRNVNVIGYANPQAQERHNRGSTVANADSVVSYLASKGVAREHISMRTQRDQTANEADAGGSGFERRVDITLAE